MATRTIALGGTRYPLVLPRLRDPRLGIAAVVLSIHVLGQTGLHFTLGIPQLLAAILTCAVIEMIITFRRQRVVAWPASALLTGSGVALLMRVVGTPPDQPWYLDGWYLFAGVAAFSLLSKYVVRYRGRNVFNPSNVGLVVAFLVFGSGRLEPLALWWAPPNGMMIAAYAIILGGGAYVVWRARMTTITVVFYVTFVVFQGLLAASGHCITANWAFAPVCGTDYWRVVALSPEVLIYAYFMVTDPPTVPAGRVGRVVFGVATGILTTLLMAPQTDEWGAKVALLGGLTIMLTARPILERITPEAGSAQDSVVVTVRRFARGPGRSRLVTAVAAGVAVAVIGTGIVAAGTPARTATLAGATEALTAQDVVNPTTLPPLSVSQSVRDWDVEIADGAPQLMLALSQNLAVEGRALLRSDPNLLAAVDHGDRLDEMTARLQRDTAAGTCTVDLYTFDSVTVTLIVPFGVQSGLSLGFDARGTVTHVTYDRSRKAVAQSSQPFAQTFALRRATGARWLNVAVLPPGTGS